MFQTIIQLLFLRVLLYVSKQNACYSPVNRMIICDHCRYAESSFSCSYVLGRSVWELNLLSLFVMSHIIFPKRSQIIKTLFKNTFAKPRTLLQPPFSCRVETGSNCSGCYRGTESQNRLCSSNASVRCAGTIWRITTFRRGQYHSSSFSALCKFPNKLS